MVKPTIKVSKTHTLTQFMRLTELQSKAFKRSKLHLARALGLRLRELKQDNPYLREY